MLPVCLHMYAYMHLAYSDFNDFFKTCLQGRFMFGMTSFTFAVLSVCSHIEQMLISLSVYPQNAVTIMIMHKVFTC